MRTANTEFDDAFTRSPDDLDAAMGFGLTELLLLAEDDNLNRALRTLGFSADVDAEDLVFGDNALFDRLTRGTCEDLTPFLESQLRYPPMWDGDDGADLVKADATVGDLLEEVSKMAPRLERIASAFEAAGELVDGSYDVELSGSCGGGLGRVAFQAPELYGMASLLTAVRASVVAAEGYDWALPLEDLFVGNERTLRDLYNQHLLFVVDADRIKRAGDIVVAAIDLADRGLAEASRISGPVEDQLFDWSRLDRGVIADLRPALTPEPG